MPLFGFFSFHHPFDEMSRHHQHAPLATESPNHNCHACFHDLFDEMSRHQHRLTDPQMPRLASTICSSKCPVQASARSSRRRIVKRCLLLDVSAASEGMPDDPAAAGGPVRAGGHIYKQVAAAKTHTQPPSPPPHIISKQTNKKGFLFPPCTGRHLPISSRTFPYPLK